MTEDKIANMEEDLSEKDIELGGNIVLAGLKKIGKGELGVVKKLVGSYARKMSDNIEGFEELKLVLKTVHRTEASEKYEIHAHVTVKGKPVTSEATERNLFVVLDDVLKTALTLATKI